MKRKVRNFFRKLGKAMKKPEMRMLPGQLAFFFLLSLIPLILLLILATSFIPNTFNSVIDIVENAFPAGTGEFIRDIIDPSKLDANFFIFVLIALYMATNGTHSIVVASDNIYNMRRTNYIKARIKATFIIVYLIFIFTIFLLIPVFANNIINFITDIIGNNVAMKIFSSIYHVLKWPISFLFILFSVKLIYTISPNERIKSSTVNYGSIFTTIFWIIGTKIFSYYVSNFANYDVFYGSISNIIVLMLWIYLLSYVFMLGMCLNAVDYQNVKND